MSRLPFELFLALRYLRPKRTFVSIITLISILGVMLGVAVLIIVISVMSGFDKQLRDSILGFNAHLRVLENGGPMSDYRLVRSIVASNQLVKGASPFVMDQVVMKTQPRHEHETPQVRAPYLRGIDPVTEGQVSKLPSSVTIGAFDLSGYGLLVGSGLADSMNLHEGDRVALLSPQDLMRMEQSRGTNAQPAEVIPPKDYEVRGIFDVGFYEYNNTVIVTSLENAQELYELDDTDTVNGLLVVLNNPLLADRARAQLQQALGPGFTIYTWLEDSSVMAAVLVEKNVMLYTLFFIVIVAAFGITCNLITFIVMKTGEIGLLKAVGATDRQVLSVFVLQSMLVSVMGIGAGLGLGLLAVSYRNEFLRFMRNLTGAELFPANIYQFSQLPALIVPGDIAIICGGSLIICLLAAAFPARHASKLNPVEALRHE